MKDHGLPPDFFIEGYSKFMLNDSGWLWLAREYDNSVTFTQLGQRNEKFTIPSPLKDCGTRQKIFKYDVQWRLADRITWPGLIIIGDAASCMDPAAGQGILNAIYSAVKSVEAIASCIDQPDRESQILMQYSESYIGRISSKFDQLKSKYQELGLI